MGGRLGVTHATLWVDWLRKPDVFEVAAHYSRIVSFSMNSGFKSTITEAFNAGGSFSSSSFLHRAAGCSSSNSWLAEGPGAQLSVSSPALSSRSEEKLNVLDDSDFTLGRNNCALMNDTNHVACSPTWIWVELGAHRCRLNKRLQGRRPGTSPIIYSSACTCWVMTTAQLYCSNLFFKQWNK